MKGGKKIHFKLAYYSKLKEIANVVVEAFRRTGVGWNIGLKLTKGS